MKKLLSDFRSSVASRPSPEDVKSIIGNTGAGAAVTIVNSSVFVLSILETFDAFIFGWWVLTLLLCCLIYLRSHRAAGKTVTRVSRRAANRLFAFSVLVACPWAVLALYVIGYSGTGNELVVLMVCAGMSAGGTFMLYRTLLAALGYSVPILLSVIVAVHIGGSLEAWHITVYTLVYMFSLAYFAFAAGQTSKERDISVVALSQSVAELKLAEDDNYRLANVDSVTGLANRIAFREYLHEQAKKACQGDHYFTLFLLDLDHFKNINDLFGHAVGDELLSVIGERLAHFVGPDDYVARLGGDEFALVLKSVSVDDCETIAKRLIRLLSDPTLIAGQHIHPGVSIGAACVPVHAIRPSDMLCHADLALNCAKERGRGNCVVFDEALSAQIVESDRIEKGLRKALAAGLIQMAYQPKVSLESGRIVGAEALLRWSDPVMGNVSPINFLPIAADRGLLPDLSREIAERVAKDILRFRESGIDPGKVSVNIHPVELKSPKILMENVQHLASHGVTPDDLVLEVTEGCFVGRGTEMAPMALDALTDQGYELSLDDFGTGHASLSHLRNLPVAEIKIDRMFVAGICDDEQDRSIVSAIGEIARGMGIRSVAEGVETEEQYELVKKLGIDLGQGYLWSRPVFVDEYIDLIRQSENVRPLQRSA